MQTPHVDAIVVGAGVIGLAVARALARRGLEVVVLEAERAIGRHQSSRNSEVLHAGLYYPPGSWKARLCIEGRPRLVRLCEQQGVPHREVGKLVVATTIDELAILERIEANAHACGAPGLRMLDAADVQRMEPQVRAMGALFSPHSGIVDSDALLRLLRRQAEDRGASVVLACPVRRVRVRARGLEVTAGDDVVACRMLVNAAGLGAHAVARSIEGLSPEHVPPRHLAKGSYFRAAGRPLSRLVYPVPASASLGIHGTIDLGGGVRFGPDQQWVTDVDYAVDPARAASFYAAVRRWLPALADGALQPDYAGVRAKIQGPGEPMADFAISDPSRHGVPGLVNLFGIESPGLTACLTLADLVAARLLGGGR
jgi:L-2-hydroxyglutarate oxidase LhgO